MATDSTNDVWATLTDLGGKFISANRDINIARSGAATRSTPGGMSDQTVANPFPGTQGAYPQAEAKPSPGAVSFGVNIGSMWMWILGAVVLFVVLGLRK